jgi:hypothetical protein
MLPQETPVPERRLRPSAASFMASATRTLEIPLHDARIDTASARLVGTAAKARIT